MAMTMTLEPIPDILQPRSKRQAPEIILASGPVYVSQQQQFHAFLKTVAPSLGVEGPHCLDHFALLESNITMRWPVDTSWHDYPVVDGPYWKLSDWMKLTWLSDPEHRTPSRFTDRSRENYRRNVVEPGDIAALRGSIQECRKIVLLGSPRQTTGEPEFEGRLYRLMVKLQLLGIDKEIVVYPGMHDSTPVALSSNDLQTIHAREHCMERWQWTWLVNQEAMFGRPVRLAFQGEANTPETKVIRDLWTLLLLRALAGNGTRTAPAWPPVIMKEEEQGQIVNAPGSIATYSGPHPWARTDDSGACRITYPGTGAYPTADIDPCNAHYMLASVYDAGLAGLDAAGVPCLTSAGHRFMAMVHPALLDPDAVLRWRDRVSALDDIDRRVKARDSWLRNAFRKQKALVNRLRED